MWICNALTAAVLLCLLPFSFAFEGCGTPELTKKKRHKRNLAYAEFVADLEPEVRRSLLATTQIPIEVVFHVIKSTSLDFGVSDPTTSVVRSSKGSWASNVELNF
jgi:hypothetical protein